MIINVVGVRLFDFLDKQNNPVKGVTVFHLADGIAQNNELGLMPQKITLPIEAWSQVSGLSYPCNVELVTEQRLGSKGIYTKAVGIKQLQK